MAEIRMAVIGVGRMGLTHAENLAHRVRGAWLVTVTTSREERAAEARLRCGEVAVYPTLEALLAAERLDAVVIASSTSAHADNVERCAAAGWHIFCEKPLTRYGHDLRVEVIGEEGAVQVGRFRHTPVRLLDRRGVHHDMARTTPERLGEAFVTELRAFVDCVVRDIEPPVTGHDSRATVAVGVAATQSMHEGRAVNMTELMT